MTTPVEQPVERLWESYRDKGLPKNITGQELRQHRESFFAGATAMVALFGAPLKVAGLMARPQLLEQWLTDIFTEVQEHARNRGRS